MTSRGLFVAAFMLGWVVRGAAAPKPRSIVRSAWPGLGGKEVEPAKLESIAVVLELGLVGLEPCAAKVRVQEGRVVACATVHSSGADAAGNRIKEVAERLADTGITEKEWRPAAKILGGGGEIVAPGTRPELEALAREHGRPQLLNS